MLNIIKMDEKDPKGYRRSKVDVDAFTKALINQIAMRLALMKNAEDTVSFINQTMLETAVFMRLGTALIEFRDSSNEDVAEEMRRLLEENIKFVNESVNVSFVALEELMTNDKSKIN